MGDLATANESVYVVPGEATPEAITSSLRALLPTRHHPILRHRFTVLDTFDERVRRAGACLTRAGFNGTSTVAWQPRGRGSRLAVRLQQPVSFVWDLPDGPMQQALAPVVGVRRLLDQADAEAYGSLLEVLDDRQKTVARVRIESGQARLPGESHEARAATSFTAWRPLPTILTLSGLRGYEDTYARLVPVIQSRPGIKSCPEGSTEVILGQVGVPRRGDVSSPHVELAPTVRADLGARQIHLALLGILGANEPGLRANLDTEFLHDFRVTVRRTRSLLGQIRRVFPPDTVGHFSTEFSWIGRLTGPPRDMDVLMLSLREQQGSFSADEIEALMAFLGRAQQQEHAGLVQALNSDRYRRLLSEWEAFLERPVPSELEGPNAGQLLVETVSRRAWKLSRRIARSCETLDTNGKNASHAGHTAAERLHAVRIDAKKLRYLVDVTPQFFDAADLQCILGALKKLQRVLGDFNDAHVQEKRLLDCGRALGAAGGPPGALLALGRLAERSRERRERLREEVAEKLARFGARQTRSACRRAFKRARPGERAR